MIPQVLSASAIRGARLFLEELYERASSWKIRNEFNQKAPPEQQEADLPTFVPDDATAIYDAGTIMREMQRLRDNEDVFVAWIQNLIDAAEFYEGTSDEKHEGHSSNIKAIREALKTYRDAGEPA